MPVDARVENQSLIWSLIDMISPAVLLVVFLVVFSRVVTATGPGEATTLPAVLESGGLPPAFTYAGLTWRAVASGHFGRQYVLIEVGQLVEGFPVYVMRRREPGPLTDLFIPAADPAPPGIYVRYGRAP